MRDIQRTLVYLLCLPEILEGSNGNCETLFLQSSDLLGNGIERGGSGNAQNLCYPSPCQLPQVNI